MKTRLLSLFIISFSSLKLFAFPCFFTVMKDSCWTNYDVTIAINDIHEEKPMLTVTVPKGKSWVRQQTDCNIGQKLTYSATFSPIIWENQANMVYKVQQIVTLPTAIQPKETAWDLHICFSEAFAKVPMPPSAGANCICNFNTIPAVEPLS